MHISRTEVPGNGVVEHHMTTRRGELLCLMVDDVGDRHLFTLNALDLDEPAWEIVLDADEARQLAEVLSTRVDGPIGDRGL